MSSTSVTEYEAVCAAIEGYVEAARTGNSEPMRKVFHPDAWIFGWFDGEPFNGPIDGRMRMFMPSASMRRHSG